MLVTVPNLEIVQAGVDYKISTGTVSFTMEDLADAVRAASEDPAIKAPRLKLGHLDPLNATLQDQDGQPALGTVQNMRLSDKGNVILGDYVGVPEWLASIMPSAYPSRSFEGGYNIKSNGTDRTYRMVIKAVALLGVTWPGCATIDDIQSLYGSEVPNGVEIAAAAPTGKENVQVSFDIAASVNVDDVRRQFYDGPGEETDDFLWVQAIYVDPYTVIVMNESEDQLERYSFECSPDGEVTFSEPEPVVIQYVPDPLAAGEQQMRMIACAGRNVAIYASRSESRPDQKDPKGGQRMTPEELRQSIGLPAEATDEEVRAKLAELQGNAGSGEPEREPTAEPSQQNVDSGGEPVAHGVPSGQTPAAPAPAPDAGTGEASTGPEVQAGSGDGNVTVPAEVWAQVQAGAQRGSEVWAAEQRRDRDETIEKALERGKIAAAQKEQFQTLWEKDPKGTKHLLTAPVEAGGLAENLVPVQARGVTPGGEDLEASTASEYPQEWLAPTERARIAAAAGGAIPGTTTSAGRD